MTRTHQAIKVLLVEILHPAQRLLPRLSPARLLVLVQTPHHRMILARLLPHQRMVLTLRPLALVLPHLPTTRPQNPVPLARRQQKLLVRLRLRVLVPSLRTQRLPAPRQHLQLEIPMDLPPLTRVLLHRQAQVIRIPIPQMDPALVPMPRTQRPLRLQQGIPAIRVHLPRHHVGMPARLPAILHQVGMRLPAILNRHQVGTLALHPPVLHVLPLHPVTIQLLPATLPTVQLPPVTVQLPPVTIQLPPMTIQLLLLNPVLRLMPIRLVTVLLIVLLVQVRLPVLRLTMPSFVEGIQKMIQGRRNIFPLKATLLYLNVNIGRVRKGVITTEDLSTHVRSRGVWCLQEI